MWISLGYRLGGDCRHRRRMTSIHYLNLSPGTDQKQAAFFLHHLKGFLAYQELI